MKSMWREMGLQETYEGEARDGCNDAFSVFGFLAVLLALLDLLIELGDDGRRKRDAGQGNTLAQCSVQRG